MVRAPKLAELREGMLGPVIGAVFDFAGITDEDLPDLIDSEMNFDDPAEIARVMPRVAAKLAAIWPDEDGDD